ncbi:MAG TPA: hypothetical protein VF244_01560 [Acidimicrobiales bacterium]
MRTRHVFDLSNTDHILRKVHRRVTVEPDGCWRWAGSHTHDGYARIQAKVIGKGWVGARLHRLLYVIQHEGEDPVSLHHACHHRWCVNPDHLVPTTPQEHRAEHHRQTECPKGHPLSGDNLLVKPDGRPRCRACANERNKQYRRAASTFARGEHKTHCKHGHPWVPENIYTKPKTGHQECRTCMAERSVRNRSA